MKLKDWLMIAFWTLVIAAGIAFIVFYFKSILTADVAPVVHGHRVDNGGSYARCSQCDGVLPLCANYCPNCGAKMDGGADNDTN